MSAFLGSGHLWVLLFIWRYCGENPAVQTVEEARWLVSVIKQGFSRDAHCVWHYLRIPDGSQK